MIWLCVALARAAVADGDPILDALTDEMERAVGRLTLDDAPPIYHLRYRLVSSDALTVHAAAGALVYERDQPSRALGVELRVGTPLYDNTGFGGWEDGFQVASLPRDLTPRTVHLEAWRATDAAYKQAVEQFARKSAQFTPPTDYPGDYTLTGPAIFDDGAGAPLEADRLVELARQLSAPLVGAPLIAGDVWVGAESGSAWIVDTEGTRARLPVEECTLRASAEVRTDDGMILTDQRLWTARTAAGLPPAEEMVAEVTAMRDALVALASAPTLDDEYVGPVVFEDAAATDLFRYLLGDQIEGTPEEIPFDSWFGELGMAKDSVRIGRRVLPPGWTAVDDPTSHPDEPGAYVHDWEGIPAEAVTVIEDGITRSLLMSRVPRAGIAVTNGHARGYLGLRSEGRVSQLEVEPPKRESQAKLYKSAQKLARAYGREWILVVRRLQEPSIASAAGAVDPFGEDGIALPPPVAMVRVYADGRPEETIRGAQFAGVERWLLRDLAMAGPQEDDVYLAPIYGDDWWYLSPTEGLPTRISAPTVLVGEVELVPAPGDPQDSPVIPPPER